MDETLERSIRSIQDLIDDKFEILVVDDGSSDNSIDILEELESELDQLRVLSNPNQYYFRTRAFANDNARGDYILVEFDTDDEYLYGVRDFISIFHQIEEQVDFDPFLSGNHIHMGKKELLNEENFRNLGYGGARDLWRRLIARGSFIGLHHKRIKRSIGYERKGIGKVRTRFEHLVTEFRGGITPQSYFLWCLKKGTRWRPGNDLSLGSIIFGLASTLPAYLFALRAGIYNDLPAQYRNMSCNEKFLTAHKMTLSDIESHYDITIDRSQLTEKGRDIFDPNPSHLHGPRYWLNERIDIGLTPEDLEECNV